MKIKQVNFKTSVRIMPIGEATYLTEGTLKVKAINVTHSGQFVLFSSPVETVAVPLENIRYMVVESEEKTASEKAKSVEPPLNGPKSKKQ